MNIVFITTLFPPQHYGGAEISTKILAETLSKNGHQVTVYTHGNNKTYTIGGLVVKEIPEIVPSRPCRTLFHSVYSNNLRLRLLKENDFLSADIIHACDMYMISDLSGWQKIKNKMIVTIRDYGLICPKSTLFFENEICLNYCHNGKGFVCLNGKSGKCRKRLTYLIRKNINDTVLRNSKNIICVSKFIENELLKITPTAKTKIIGNPISNSWFLNNQNVHKDIDILYVGVLAEYKGIGVLLRAIPLIEKEYAHIHVTVIGEDKFHTYERTINKNTINTAIEFKGVIPYEQISSFIQRAKIVVIPSLWPEPFGRTVIEAMACGCVVVASNVGGIPEIISSKRDGILIPPNKPIILKKTILNLLQFPKRRISIGNEAKKHVMSTYGATMIAKIHEEYYESIVKGHF